MSHTYQCSVNWICHAFLCFIAIVFKERSGGCIGSVMPLEVWCEGSISGWQYCSNKYLHWYGIPLRPINCKCSVCLFWVRTLRILFTAAILVMPPHCTIILFAFGKITWTKALMETETHSQMLFRKCKAVGFLQLITRTQLFKVKREETILSYKNTYCYSVDLSKYLWQWDNFCNFASLHHHSGSKMKLSRCDWSLDFKL